MARARGPGQAAAVLLAAALATGCYNPNPESGTLRCGPSNSCPEGYTCRSGLCYKAGDLGRLDAIPRYVGHWVFGSGTIDISCSDNTRDVSPLAGDVVDITAGQASDIVAAYFCFWSADLTSNGAGTVIDQDQSCDFLDTTSGTLFTYYGNSFNFATGDGRNATLSSSIDADYLTTTGDSGTCELDIAGALTKM